MTKDEFRILQKRQCPPLYGRRQSKNAVYGCPCCKSLPLNLFKKVSRRRAKRRLKDSDKKSEFNTKD